jgi:hypothetical protein
VKAIILPININTHLQQGMVTWPHSHFCPWELRWLGFCLFKKI